MLTLAPAPARTELLDLVRLATMAPSGHNAQPWHFAVDDGVIRILPDYARRLPAVDPDDHALWISLGAAAETIAVAAGARGLSAEVEVFPRDEPEPCLRVRLERTGIREHEVLAAAIPVRQTTRCAFDPAPLHSMALLRIARAAERDGVRVLVVTDAGVRAGVARQVEAAVRHQSADGAAMAELAAWTRLNRAQVAARRDGLDVAALGFPRVPAWLGRWLLRMPQARAQAKLVRTSPALLVLAAAADDCFHWVETGRALQRAALTATEQGIKQAHANAACEVREIRAKLASLLALPEGWEPLLLLRLGLAPSMPRAPRRPLEDVLV